ncbi:hypothetical protein BGZ49_009939 [Haplosporangium sp. Z 27]|nr:hypothetical protein BGZ49_009939 [Haplosporangium sp. Z 27]
MCNCTELARIEEVVSSDGEEVETAEKIVLGDNWICLGLKSLTMAFTVSKSGKRLDSVYTTRVERQRKLEQEHAFRQLSRLSRLEVLNISHHSSNHDTLDVRLESRGGGLEGLASLKSLEQFLFYGTSPDVNEDDINWMVEHWPRLRVMFGRFSYDFVESYILQSYAEEKLSQLYRCINANFQSVFLMQ